MGMGAASPGSQLGKRDLPRGSHQRQQRGDTSTRLGPLGLQKALVTAPSGPSWPENPSPGWFQPSSLCSWWDLQFVLAGSERAPSSWDDSSSITPSIPAPAQPIALCVSSSRCTAAHVHTQESTNGYKLPSRQSLRTSKLLRNQSTFRGGNAVNWKGKNAQRGF